MKKEKKYVTISLFFYFTNGIQKTAKFPAKKKAKFSQFDYPISPETLDFYRNNQKKRKVVFVLNVWL